MSFMSALGINVAVQETVQQAMDTVISENKSCIAVKNDNIVIVDVKIMGNQNPGCSLNVEVSSTLAAKFKAITMDSSTMTQALHNAVKNSQVADTKTEQKGIPFGQVGLSASVSASLTRNRQSIMKRFEKKTTSQVRIDTRNDVFVTHYVGGDCNAPINVESTMVSDILQIKKDITNIITDEQFMSENRIEQHAKAESTASFDLIGPLVGLFLFVILGLGLFGSWPTKPKAPLPLEGHAPTE